MKKLKGKVSFGVVYLMLIPVFAVIYDLLPEGYIAYSQLDDNILTNLYYSAVTITTLGFGDVTPLNEAAAVLVGAEAVLGVVVAPLGVLLGGVEQLFGFLRILLEHRCVAHLALKEVDELVPIGLLAVEGEGVLALFGCENLGVAFFRVLLSFAVYAFLQP